MGKQIQLAEELKRNELFQKINDLFEYRMFPFLLENINVDTVSKDIFYGYLIDLQEAIYRLDAHLESHWVLNPDERKILWHNIVLSIKKCIPPHIHPNSLLHHIEKYEKHEMEIRDGKLPTRLQMSYFYFYKSCDVKLLRNLLYRYGSLEKQFGSLSKWRDFDFITEINDDISDIYEDMNCYNGNRFLMQLLLSGKKETFLVYGNFLDLVLDTIQRKLNETKSDSFDHQLAMYAHDQGRKTKKLLEETLDNVNIDVLKGNSLLSDHILKF